VSGRVSATCAGLLLCLAACATMDPRGERRHAEQATTGGWIEVTLRNEAGLFRGELVSVDQSSLHVLMGTLGPKGWVPGELRRVPRSDVSSAKLYAYDVGNELGVWSTTGMVVSALSVIGPVLWGVAALLGDVDRTDRRTVSYPDEGLDELAIWARFPQGMPAGMTFERLLQDL
jgi:hypothetical protein